LIDPEKRKVCSMVQGELNFSRIYIHSKPLSYQQQFQRVLLQIQKLFYKDFQKNRQNYSGKMAKIYTGQIKQPTSCQWNTVNWKGLPVASVLM